MEEVIFRSRLFEVVTFDSPPGTNLRQFERARRAPGVRVLLADEYGEKFLLSAEFRSEVGGVDIRLPGGKLFDSVAEGSDFWSLSSTAKIPEAEEAARRELREELGVETDGLALLEVTPCGATVEWDIYFFIGRGWRASPLGHAWEPGEEGIRPTIMTASDLWDAAHNGSMSEARSAHVICKFLYERFEKGIR